VHTRKARSLGNVKLTMIVVLNESATPKNNSPRNPSSMSEKILSPAVEATPFTGSGLFSGASLLVSSRFFDVSAAAARFLANA